MGVKDLELGKKLGGLRVLWWLNSLEGINEEERREEGLGSVINCKDTIAAPEIERLIMVRYEEKNVV